MLNKIFDWTPVVILMLVVLFGVLFYIVCVEKPMAFLNWIRS